MERLSRSTNRWDLCEVISTWVRVVSVRRRDGIRWQSRAQGRRRGRNVGPCAMLACAFCCLASVYLGKAHAMQLRSSRRRSGVPRAGLALANGPHRAMSAMLAHEVGAQKRCS